MAKIITENFRVSNTKEFIESFAKKNEVAANTIRNSIRDYLVRYGLLQDGEGESLTDFTDTQKADVADIALSNLNDIKPENDYYVFASSVDREVGEAIANTQLEKRDFLRRVIFGRKIDATDIRYMFSRNDWVANKVYDAFDDTIDIENIDMYVTVLDGIEYESSFKVFKCLRNNDGAPSTIEPSISLLNSDFETEALSDGYVWKYMFEVPAVEYIAYATTTDLPYVADERVSTSSTESISDIVIEQTPTFLFQDLNLGETLVLGVTDLTPNDPTIATKTWRIELLVKDKTKPIKVEPNAYENMYIRVVDPTDNDVSHFDIKQSEVVATGVTDRLYIYIELSIGHFDGAYPDIEGNMLNKEAYIVPKVKVSRSLGEPAVAYGIVDTAGTLTDIEFINRGSEYKYASARLLLPDSIAEREVETELRVITSPMGGHGADPITELFMSKAVVVTNFFTSAETPIPSSNFYTKIGLVKNPSFTSAEEVYPLTFDNRMSFEVSGDVTATATAGRWVEQAKSYENVYGKIHEAVYDGNSTTTIYLTDYVGDWADTFIPGTISIKDNQDDLVIIETLTINNIKINQIEKTFTDGTPSGDFEDNGYVPYSGEVLHFIDFDKIERQPTRKEKVKLVFDF